MDQLTEKHQLPVTRFGLEWMGSSVTPQSSSVRRIELLGMKGPNNFFTIFLPKKALQEPERNREGMHCSCLCVYVCVCVCPVHDNIWPDIKCLVYRKNFDL